MKAETKEKYTQLVVMENTCFMLQELSKLSKLEKSQNKANVAKGDQSVLDQAIKDTRLVFTKAFKNYCTDQYSYMFKNLIADEAKLKSPEKIRKLY